MTIRLTAEEEACLGALAERTGRTKSFYVRAALHEYLDDLEDQYAADAAVKNYEAAGRASRPFADLVKETGLSEADIAEGRRLNREAP